MWTIVKIGWECSLAGALIPLWMQHNCLNLPLSAAINSQSPTQTVSVLFQLWGQARSRKPMIAAIWWLRFNWIVDTVWENTLLETHMVNIYKCLRTVLGEIWDVAVMSHCNSPHISRKSIARATLSVWVIFTQNIHILLSAYPWLLPLVLCFVD